VKLEGRSEIEGERHAAAVRIKTPVTDRVQRPCRRNKRAVPSRKSLSYISTPLLRGDADPVHFVPPLARDLEVRSFVPIMINNKIEILKDNPSPLAGAVYGALDMP
jgi:hypothetical protein